MWSQLLLSKFTRPLLTHQSQEAIIILFLYRMPFLPRKLQSPLLTLGFCGCQERNVAPLTSKRASEAHGRPAGPQWWLHTHHCLHFIRDHNQCSALRTRKQKRQQQYQDSPIPHSPRQASEGQEWPDTVLWLSKPHQLSERIAEKQAMSCSS